MSEINGVQDHDHGDSIEGGTTLRPEELSGNYTTKIIRRDAGGDHVYDATGSNIQTAINDLEGRSGIQVGKIILPIQVLDVSSTVSISLDPNSLPAFYLEGSAGMLSPNNPTTNAAPINSTISNGDNVIEASGGTSHGVWSGFSVYGSSNDGDALNLEVADNGTIQDVTIKNPGNFGIRVGTGGLYSIKRANVVHTGSDGISLSPAQAILNQIEVENAGRDGLRVNGVDVALLKSVELENSSNAGLQLASNPRYVRAIGGKYVKNGTYGAVLGGGEFISLVNIRFRDNSSGAIFTKEAHDVWIAHCEIDQSGTVGIEVGDSSERVIIGPNDYTAASTPVQINSGAKDTLIKDPSLSPADISDSGTRTVFNGRYLNPPTLSLGGSNGSISPTISWPSTYDLFIDAGGSNSNLQGIDNIAHNGVKVRLHHTGGESVVLEHNNSTASNPLLNQSGANDTLDANGEMVVYEYDGQNSVWRQTALNQQAA